MDENKHFYDVYGYQLNPIEFHNWMIYQQSYVNFPSYIFQGNVGLNYDNLPYQNNFDQSYSSIVPTKNYYKLKPNVSSNHQDNTRFTRNSNNNEFHKKSNKSPRFQPTLSSEIEGSTKCIKTKSSQDLPVSSKNKNSHDTITSSKTFEILNRNKKGDEEKFRKAFTNTSKIELDKDFPPICSTSANTESNVECDKSLDYRLALQKPKPNYVEKINEQPTNVKKKKKRKNKNKKPAETFESFSFVDEEFPSLNVCKPEIKEPVILEAKSENDAIKNKANVLTEKRKGKKRQLVFILPGDLEGQVRIVHAPTIQKNKTKTKRNQDRLKRPIGSLNPLDLSAPSLKRGKERLHPKPKKPTKLKKTILNYRNLKKVLREKSVEKESNTKSSEISNSGNLEAKSELITAPTKRTAPDNLVNRMHSKHFREYCNHMIDNKINSVITQLLKTLIGFQDKLYNRDPVKAKLKRRLCFGLREVTKFVNMKKLRLIIIAPDLEKIDIEGGLDDIVGLIIKMARESGVPYVFGLNRSSLAYLCYKKFRVGAIGIFNYDGAETQVKELLVSVDAAREQYNQIKQVMESISQDVSAFDQQSLGTSANNGVACSCDATALELVSTNHCAPCNGGHSRTPSNALSEPISDIGEMNKLLFNSILEDQIKPEPALEGSVSDEEDELKEEDTTVIETRDEDQNEDDEEENELIDRYVDNILYSVSRMDLNSDETQ